jgi:hypothetical protein
MDEKLTMREILSGHVHTRQRGADMKSVEEYPHLLFSNIDHYKKALEFAKSLGEEPLRTFKESFESLERLCAQGHDVAEVRPDFAEYSFYFRMYQADGSLDMDGGIILHGLGNSFSVELIPRHEPHWSMHT